MAGPRATAAIPAHKYNMRRPPQPSLARAQSVGTIRVDRSGVVSPADSITSTATTYAGSKRKERELERDTGAETNINVVVRCRGRNDREIRENSGVVLSTDGVKGKTVKLSMGPTALSNKTYHFDKVFAPAADQSMIYDDVVTPILDEMFAGFNCTIFAYGQTGTGKTYTMSGDMNTTAGMLSEAAGIIPRTLHALFNKLELNDVENSVKCSFIELYNEELRDLISADESIKLKIFDDTSKKGHASTLVQGMEESHINSAAEGVKLLQAGSHRRQVAATKCNDLSSRSHTVFTVTAYIKRTSDNGEDYVSAGKLNLVDLAGSENIQRSGAENKRAAEAGLINKSLLTLGRVINALVDRSPHVPYRESKLTRLLQDSLGGRTKTCIIATVSPAKSNLEETISTLDYAFRAKNIRNMPQINQIINKKTLLKEFTYEIEKLKSELIATRQRNGVYLSHENFEELTTENESRRMLNEEQAVKIEAMEINLRNKVQELFSLTTNFMSTKKENEATKTILDKTKSVLEQTEFVLATAQRKLDEETILRKAHQETEQMLSVVGGELITTLGRTVDDIGQLRKKVKRKSDLHSFNRSTWEIAQAQVSEATNHVESRVQDFQSQQEKLLSEISTRTQNFVRDELEKLAATQRLIQGKVFAFNKTEEEILQQTSSANHEMDVVLEEVKTLGEEIKKKTGQGLQGLSATAERISAEILGGLVPFNTQLHASYSSIGRDCRQIFEELHEHIAAQRIEVNSLKERLRAATETAVLVNDVASSRLAEILSEERQQVSTDRQNLLAKITSLVMANGDAQENRLNSKISVVRNDITASKESLEAAQSAYTKGMGSWNYKESKIAEDILMSQESMKSRLKEDWIAANKHHVSIQTATSSVHEETIRIVDEQMKDIDVQMVALGDFVTRARSQTAQHYDMHSQSLRGLSEIGKASCESIGSQLVMTHERNKSLGDSISEKQNLLEKAVATLGSTLQQPLIDLRATISRTTLQEYEPTGETPQRTQYKYPTELPRTEPRENLIAATRPLQPQPMSPTKSAMFCCPNADENDESVESCPLAINFSASLPGLRELDINVLGRPCNSAPEAGVAKSSSSVHADSTVSVSGRSVRELSDRHFLKKTSVTAPEGRENAMPSQVQALSRGVGRRKSPRNAE